MTLEIPKEKWTEFFNDLSKRRFGWETKIEVIAEDLGDQILSEGLPLNGVTFEEKSNSLEIAVGENATQHQFHTIEKPIRVAYLNGNDNYGGVVQIEDDASKTLIRLVNPMPVYVGYTGFKIVSVS
jgi:hypothetical protein